MNQFLFICSYQNCNRKLISSNKKPFPCNSCGIGTMEFKKPKAYCCECGKPIYENVAASRDVVCDNCTSDLVMGINKSEEDMKTKFRDTFDMKQKKSYFKAKSKEKANDRDLNFRTLGRRLKSARKKVGLTQDQTAKFFNLKSKSTINQYEKNLRMIPKEIIKWIIKVEDLKKKEAREKYGQA